MQVSWPILLPLAFLVVLLVLFLIIRNRKDEKDLEEQLDKDVGRPKKHQDNEDVSA